MSLHLFDCQTGFGGASSGSRKILTDSDLAIQYERLNIDGGLIRIAPVEMETDIELTNTKLYTVCQEREQWIPCPVVMPNTGQDWLDEEEQVDLAIRNRSGAAWIRPETDYWFVTPWISDRLFQAMQDRRLPLYLSHKEISLETAAQVAGRFPDLPVILADVNYREHRMYAALLEHAPNIRLSIGTRFTVHGGIEQLVYRLGAERLVFGTGFPDSEPMGAAMQLIYAELSNTAKQKIGTENAMHLLEAIIK